jgi:outer membrane protein assembly factor BamE (lipoprotein component of BamABCDE complex)
MEYYVILVLVLVLAAILLYLYNHNRKLTKQIETLQEVLAIKDKTIANFEASRVAVKDVIENFSIHEEVMHLLQSGKSREEVAKTLGVSLGKIELIVKFDKIKREKTTTSA